MSIGAELGQCILQTHKKILKIQWGWEFEPRNSSLWVRQW